MRYVESCRLPTEWATFDLHAFEDDEHKCHLALSLGDLDSTTRSENVLARIHSECLTGDGLFSQRCDCGGQLALAMEKIAAEGQGVILYLRQEGRGIGLLNKIKAYRLQDSGADTVEANEALGFLADQRDYELCRPMLSHLGIVSLRLMTNNPAKVAALEAAGIQVCDRIAHRVANTAHNAKYMDTKIAKLGHISD